MCISLRWGLTGSNMLQSLKTVNILQLTKTDRSWVFKITLTLPTNCQPTSATAAVTVCVTVPCTLGIHYFWPTSSQCSCCTHFQGRTYLCCSDIINTTKMTDLLVIDKRNDAPPLPPDSGIPTRLFKIEASWIKNESKEFLVEFKPRSLFDLTDWERPSTSPWKHRNFYGYLKTPPGDLQIIETTSASI